MDRGEERPATGAHRAEEPGHGGVDARVYEELRELARAQLRRERASHTLQATALVHEAWMRLSGADPARFDGSRHFFGAAAEAMRRVLVDHARARGSDKRGGGRQRVTLGAIDEPVELADEQLLALDEALARLAHEDPRAAEVARLRFLCGLSAPETASALGISERSVHREWTYARARLFELMGGDAPREVSRGPHAPERARDDRPSAAGRGDPSSAPEE